MPRHNPSETTTCPHCQVAVRLESPSVTSAGQNHFQVRTSRYYSMVSLSQCPNCLREIVCLDEAEIEPTSGNPKTPTLHLLWPLHSARPPAPSQVPPEMSQDYLEAAIVLELSPKASAALSRRCLQAVLREAANTKAKELNDQILEVIPNLPSRIAQNLDAIRVVGNFAAHPLKSQVTGAIIEVEPGEAEWNLDVLDALFDYYYVRPEIERKKREDLNRKLQEAGKPPLKQ
jgi:hypothetical protein